MSSRWLGNLAVLWLLCSCDCMQHLQGRVLDAKTHEPIGRAVFYEKGEGEYPAYTDSLGNFWDYQITNGLTCRPRLTLIIEKEGYKSHKIKWKPRKQQDSLVIYLEPKVSEEGSH